MASRWPKTMKAMADELVGATIRKNFPGHGTFEGTVVSFADELFHVEYEDGDEEDEISAEGGGYAAQPPAELFRD